MKHLGIGQTKHAERSPATSHSCERKTGAACTVRLAGGYYGFVDTQGTLAVLSGSRRATTSPTTSIENHIPVATLPTASTMLDWRLVSRRSYRRQSSVAAKGVTGYIGLVDHPDEESDN